MVTRVTHRPQRAGGEKRGNCYDRECRRRWLVSPAAGFGGTGQTVPCFYCGAVLDDSTVTADRITPGGSYRHANIRPACLTCNQSRSDKPVWRAPSGQLVLAGSPA